MALFWLSDEAWSSIEPHLPKNQSGARRVDDRRVISGILHVLKAGCRWCDCPADYGPSTTVYNRFNRWSRRGFWLKLLDALVQAGAVTMSTAIDSTYIKAQRSAFGGKAGRMRYLLGDKGYDAGHLRRVLREIGTTPVIPGRRNRKRAIRYDRQRYRDRHLVENAFCRIKDFRRVATRYDKLAANFLSGMALATAIVFWL